MESLKEKANPSFSPLLKTRGNMLSLFWVNCCVPSPSVRSHPNQKPWINCAVRMCLREKQKSIKSDKRQHNNNLTENYSGTDHWRIWWGLQAITVCKSHPSPLLDAPATQGSIWGIKPGYWNEAHRRPSIPGYQYWYVRTVQISKCTQSFESVWNFITRLHILCTSAVPGLWTHLLSFTNNFYSSNIFKRK